MKPKYSMTGAAAGALAEPLEAILFNKNSRKVKEPKKESFTFAETQHEQVKHFPGADLGQNTVGQIYSNAKWKKPEP